MLIVVFGTTAYSSHPSASNSGAQKKWISHRPPSIPPCMHKCSVAKMINLAQRTTLSLGPNDEALLAWSSYRLYQIGANRFFVVLLCLLNLIPLDIACYTTRPSRTSMTSQKTSVILSRYKTSKAWFGTLMNVLSNFYCIPGTGTALHLFKAESSHL